MSEPITDDIIGECHICSEPCDRHANCLNEHCHILIIQCSKCCKKFNNCCSKHCADFLLINKEKEKIFISGEIKFNAQKSDCIKPKVKRS